jgi:hypothetical protein
MGIQQVEIEQITDPSILPRIEAWVKSSAGEWISASFKIDTGASGTVLSDELVTKLNLEVVGLESASLADGSVTNSQIGITSLSFACPVTGKLFGFDNIAVVLGSSNNLLGHDILRFFDLIITTEGQVVLSIPNQTLKSKPKSDFRVVLTRNRR